MRAGRLLGAGGTVAEGPSLVPGRPPPAPWEVSAGDRSSPSLCPRVWNRPTAHAGRPALVPVWGPRDVGEGCSPTRGREPTAARRSAGPPNLGRGPVPVDTRWGFSETRLERTRGCSCWGGSFPLGPKFLTLALYWSLAIPGRGPPSLTGCRSQWGLGPGRPVVCMTEEGPLHGLEGPSGLSRHRHDARGHDARGHDAGPLGPPADHTGGWRRVPLGDAAAPSSPAAGPSCFSGYSVSIKNLD